MPRALAVSVRLKSMFAQGLQNGLALDFLQALGVHRFGHAAAAERQPRLAAHARGQVLGQNQFAAGKQRGAFHGVAQFADVARPGILFEAFRDGGGKPRPALGQFREQLVGQRQNVLAAFAQRRNVQLHDVQAVIQILAEAALA